VKSILLEGKAEEALYLHKCSGGIVMKYYNNIKPTPSIHISLLELR